MGQDTNRDEIHAKIINYLRRKPLLGLINRKDLQRAAAVNEKEREIVNNYLYRISIGTPGAKNSPPEMFYAIRLSLDFGADQPEDVYLSLPGIPYDIIKLEDPKSQAVVDLKQKLAEKLGKAPVKYWLEAAQDRTIEIAREAMERARQRDNGKCVLCTLVDHLRKANGMITPQAKAGRLTASHIIRRKSVFWKEVDETQQKYHLFSTEGTEALINALKLNPFLSESDYIVILCTAHDGLITHTIKDFAKDFK